MYAKYLILLFFLTAGSIASFARAEDSLVGAWRLVSWVATSPSGEISTPLGASPDGQIVYTENGQMAVQLTNPDPALLDGPKPGTDDLMDWVASRYVAYFGTYSVDWDAGTVTHHLSGSLEPSWVGADQVRKLEFLEPDRLQLMAEIPADNALGAIGASGSNSLVWERVR